MDRLDTFLERLSKQGFSLKVLGKKGSDFTYSNVLLILLVKFINFYTVIGISIEKVENFITK